MCTYPFLRREFIFVHEAAEQVPALNADLTWPQERIGAALGVAQKTVSRWLDGQSSHATSLSAPAKRTHKLTPIGKQAIIENTAGSR